MKMFGHMFYFYIFFDIDGNSEIGLLLLNDFESPFFNRCLIFAFFNMSEKKSSVQHLIDNQKLVLHSTEPIVLLFLYIGVSIFD